jgi:hypothetical protein
MTKNVYYLTLFCATIMIYKIKTFFKCLANYIEIFIVCKSILETDKIVFGWSFLVRKGLNISSLDKKKLYFFKNKMEKLKLHSCSL